MCTQIKERRSIYIVMIATNKSHLKFDELIFSLLIYKITQYNVSFIPALFLYNPLKNLYIFEELSK